MKLTEGAVGLHLGNDGVDKNATIHIGKRMIVPRDRFFEWMDQQIGA